MTAEDAQELIFKALANRLRRRMLDFLRDRPRTSGELCRRFGRYDRCTVLQHLRVLERAGLIIVRRSGRYRWNYLNVLPIQEIHERWISRYATRAVGLLARLKRDLEQ